MKKKTILIATAAAALSLGIGAKVSADTDMYRMYNPNSGEHFYTATPSERDNLVKVGWNYEGIGWVAPDSGAPVYRLYNPNAGDHFYTLSSFEKDSLVKAGWNSEGIGWYSGGNIPLYRAYNPNAVAGAHNYTTGAYEQSQLIADGWKDEKIGWYGVGMGRAIYTRPADSIDVYSRIIEVGYSSNPNSNLIKPGKYVVTSLMEDSNSSRIDCLKIGDSYLIDVSGAPDPDSVTITVKLGDTLDISGHVLLTLID